MNITGILLPLLLISLTRVTCFRQSDFHKEKNKKSGAPVIRSMLLGSDVGCLEECRITSGCSSINTGPETSGMRMCELLGKSENAQPLQDEDGWSHWQDNECSFGVICQNDGTCVDDVNGYYCECSPGYEGEHCQTDTDECFGIVCQNSGSCVDEVNGYHCECSPGYEGDHCQTDTDECFGVICQNDGTCVDDVNGYHCECSPGYEGDHCQTDTDECFGVICQNDGTCVDDVNGYHCECSPGYEGDHCQTDTDECSGVICQNSGTCVDEVNGYYCECSPGYEGEHCQTDTDECSGVICQNDGTCVDELNGYHCECSPGYEGDHCQRDSDDCSGVVCQNGGSCVDEVNGYHCECSPGYSGNHNLIVSSLFNFGNSNGVTLLQAGDDITSNAVTSSIPFRFFGNTATRFYVATNGILSLTSAVTTYRPTSFPSRGSPLFGLFWGDVDTRYSGSIYYRVVTDSSTRQDIYDCISSIACATGASDFEYSTSWIFLATWHQVPPYSRGQDENTFQIAIATDGTYSFAIYKYEQIEWTHPTNNNGHAQVGFNAGDGRNYYSMVGSQTAGVANLVSTSNVDTPGTWIFKVDQTTIDDLG